jgi:hypothetical protein
VDIKAEELNLLFVSKPHRSCDMGLESLSTSTAIPRPFQ